MSNIPRIIESYIVQQLSCLTCLGLPSPLYPIIKGASTLDSPTELLVFTDNVYFVYTPAFGTST